MGYKTLYFYYTAGVTLYFSVGISNFAYASINEECKWLKSTKNREKYEELQQIILITSNCFIWGFHPVSGNRYKFLFKAAERKFQDSTIQERNGASKIGSKNFMQRF